MANLNISLNQSKILSEKLIYCSVCLEQIPFGKTMDLSCHHRYCTECLSREWEYNIMNGYFSADRLKCPNDKCNRPISYYELKSLLKPEVFKRYEDNSIKNFQTQKDSPEIAIICPNKKCQQKFMVSKKLSYFKCEECKMKYCLDCFGDWSLHEGKKCNEFKENGISKEEKEFMEEIKRKKWMPCPECKTVVEKIEFCNFIRCSSPKCEKKTCFCYLCGQKLTQTEHFDHFVDKNPYGNVCNNMINKEKNNSEKSTSSGKCPKCGENDPEICEFIGNFNNRICFCKSKTCQSQYICLRCREYLNAKMLNKHLDQKDFDCINLSSIEKICIIF